MPAIIHEKWGGLIPKLDPMALPPNAATVAKNIDLTGGKLLPAKFVTPFQRLHDDDGKMVGQLVAVRDIASVPKPVITGTATSIRMCNNINSWLTVTAGIWLTWTDPTNGTFMETEVLNASQGYGSMQYTADGIKVHFSFDDCTCSLIPGIVYTVHGPKYKFAFAQDTAYKGGPSAPFTFPSDFDWSSPDFPVISLPLEWPVSMDNYATTWSGARYVYAYLTLLDVNGPKLPSQLYLDPDDPNIVKLTWPIAGVKVTTNADLDIYFRLEYARSASRFAYYLRTFIDQAVAQGVLERNYGSGHRATIKLTSVVWDDDDIPQVGRLVIDPTDDDMFDDVRYTSWTKSGTVYTFNIHASDDLAYGHGDGKLTYVEDQTVTEMEGPPSEMTNMLAIDPGIVMALALTVPTTGRYTRQKIYRSATGGNDFVCLNDCHDITAVFYDDFTLPGLHSLPPYGNFPQDTVADACEGSVITPGQWAATIWKNELRPSDLYRFHAYPDEYAVPFDTDIMAIVVGGGNLIVFTEANTVTGEQGKVFLVAGSPGALSIYELANVSPLLQVTSIARIDQTVYYASRDGIMAISGGGTPSLITRDLFRRPAWTNERPDLMQAWVCDRGLFLIVDIGGHNNLRLDTGEGAATLTRFSKLTGIGEFEWQSRPFDFGQPVELANVKVHADVYPVVISVYNEDGEKAGERSVESGRLAKMPVSRRSRVWSYGVKGYGTVYRVAIGTSADELAGG